MSDEIESKERHTPGPWVLDLSDPHGCGDITLWMGKATDPRERGVYDPTHRIDLYSDVWDTYDDGTEMPEYRESVANARLIAAAPDMHAEIQRLRAINVELLAALQGLLADDYRNATAALANELETEAEGALIEQREAAARAAINMATEAKGPA